MTRRSAADAVSELSEPSEPRAGFARGLGPDQPSERLVGLSRLARSRGRARLVFSSRAGATELAELYQEGCLRICLPRIEPFEPLTAVLVNVGGGLTGGDSLELEVRWPADTRAAITTQAAERLYRSLPELGPARVSTRLEVGRGALAEWLPQETLVFDRSDLDRRLEVTLEDGARFVGVESLVFGREAMGEQVLHGSLRDTWDLRREGRRLLFDRLRLTGPIAELLPRPAIAGGARAVATIVHAASDAEARLEPMRERAAAIRSGGSGGSEAAASAWNGLLVARVLARSGSALRGAVAGMLEPLRDGRPLPRVWSC